jgi:integrase
MRNTILTDHIRAFRQAVEADGRTAKHAKQLEHRVTRIVEGLGVRRYADLERESIRQHLAGLDLSDQTRAHWFAALRQFVRWMLSSGRATFNPLQGLKPATVTERKYRRRALSEAELRLLVKTTTAGSEYRGVPGRERALAYLLAASTGLRAAEVRSLTAGSFSLGKRPTVTAGATNSKRRKRDTLPLTPELVVLLKAQLRAKLPAAPAFALPDKTALMLKADCKAAGIPDEIEQGVVDFHWLRKSFVTRLARAGVHPRVAQTLARHSDINLTMGTYSEVGADDQAEALTVLPKLVAAS